MSTENNPKYIIERIVYRCPKYMYRPKAEKSLEVIGLDTEAYDTGRCFLICTSLGDSYTPGKFPQCFFTRKYRGTSFVTYNLIYDEGAMIHFLPAGKLDRLREGYKVKHKGYTYFSIPGKCLTVRKGKNSIHIYDIFGFYKKSLDYNAQKYLGEKKIAMETKSFTRTFVRANRERIIKYCIHDAGLTKSLADILIKKFERFGVHPTKLYSTAYVSFQFFRKYTNYVTVKRYWDKYPEVLQAAMDAYTGGKFEVTEKGSGQMYEYDLVSAYPYEIAALKDISWARVYENNKYGRGADYGFIYAVINIPSNIFSPVAIKPRSVNIYPVGQVKACITKAEYEYLLSVGCDIKIEKAYWLYLDRKVHPYKKAMLKLFQLKKEFKTGDPLDYHTVKLFMNSIYGKFLQLIEKEDGLLHGSACWNPIYGAIVTANVRIRMCALQQKHSSIMAIHTDSIISKKPLPYKKTDQFGELSFEIKGPGVLIGSGIYQIGDKVKFRGYKVKKNLLEMVDTPEYKISMYVTHVYTWREVMARNWNKDMINQFRKVKRTISVDFDHKRIWMNDYECFRDILKRNVISVPHYSGDFLI